MMRAYQGNQEIASPMTKRGWLPAKCRMRFQRFAPDQAEASPAAPGSGRK